MFVGREEPGGEVFGVRAEEGGDVVGRWGSG